MLKVHRIINEPVSSNCFVIYEEQGGGDCLVVDPGSKSNNNLLDYLSTHDLNPFSIILTHEHFDHCWGVNDLVDRFEIPIVCSSWCADCIKSEKRNCSVFYDINERFVINSQCISIESLGSVLPFAGTEIDFFSTQGHTDACMSFLIGKNLFTGDLLIKGERTVTKLPTGSREKLIESMELLQNMKGNGYMVCPGHGDIFDLDSYDLSQMLINH